MIKSFIQCKNKLRILKTFHFCLIIITITMIGGCEDKQVPHKGENMNNSTTGIKKESIDLSNKVIFFGHQSVGYNIIDGIKDITQEDPNIKLLITEKYESKQNSGALLYHLTIGKNEEPESKVDDFKQLIDKGIGSWTNIAFFKFCYVDFNDDTKVEKVFDHYKDVMKYLKNKYPKVTFVHVTTPLTVISPTWKTWIKEITGRGKMWEYSNNIPINRYNTLLLKEYAGKEPIFDLATIESTSQNGTKNSFNSKGIEYLALEPEYTNDGGHLNDKGRRIIAEQLLIFLSNISR